MSRWRKTLLASGVRTSSGVGGVTDMEVDHGIPALQRGLFLLDVTAVSGVAPTLQVYVQQEGPDGSYVDLGAFALMTVVTKRLLAVYIPQVAFVEGAATDGG